MKIYETLHKGIQYRFEFYEKAQKVLIFKGEEHAYTMVRQKIGWKCFCPSGVYRKYCWHRTDALPNLLALPSGSEPWMEWAEDAQVMNEQIHKEQAVR